MKPIHFTYLVAATAWAASDIPYAFFANLGIGLKPLRIEDTLNSQKNLIWEDLLDTPSEFFFEHKHTIKGNTFIAGCLLIDYFRGVFFQDNQCSALLKLDGQMRLKNSFFYSCEVNNGVHKIETVKKYPECLYAEVYLLPYNKTSNAPVEGSYTQRKPVERIPYVFFIEDINGLQPLYADTVEPIDEDLVPFSHGDRTVKPLEFYSQQNYAITEDAGTMSGYAVFKNHTFGFDRVSGDPNLRLGRFRRLSKRNFYSCMDSKTNRRRITTKYLENSLCYAVQLHFLAYNRTTGLPENFSYTPKGYLY